MAHNYPHYRKRANALLWKIAEAPAWWLRCECVCGNLGYLKLFDLAAPRPSDTRIDYVLKRLTCRSCKRSPARVVLQDERNTPRFTLRLIPERHE